MKIIVVVPYLAAIGGAGRYAWELSEYLVSKGDYVIIASLYADRNLYHSKENIEVVDLADKSSLTQTIKFWYSLRKISKKLASLVKNEKPDLVLFNHFPSTLWVQKYGNIPILCYPQDIHLLYADTYISNLTLGIRLLWRILRLFVRMYDKKKWKYFDQVICNSKFSANHISRVYGVKPTIIYPGTNTQAFVPINSTSKKRVILSIANHKTRRADFLIKAASIIHQKRNDFKIWMVGSSGTYDKELKDLVKKYNLTEIVEFFGNVSDSELVKLYSESLVLVHLQKIHPFGLVFIEAMACETPVIACKPGATEEVIVHGETGFLIDENDYESLIKYIEKFLDDTNLSNTMGKEGRIRVKKYFEMSEQYDKMRELMQEWICKKSNLN